MTSPIRSLPARVTIREVGLRDGLQILQRVVPTEQKLQWIRGAYDAGQREIEVGSFVPAHLMPQLADTEELVVYAKTLPGLKASVLVPNLKGAQRALACEAEAMLVPLSASHAHSLANLRKTPDEALAMIKAIVAERDARGSATEVEIGLSTAFGCTIQGKVETSEVLRLVQGALDAGVDHIGLADTVGYADPLAVRKLFSVVQDLAGDKLNCGHFHDTRGLGLANVYSAMQLGISKFDARLAGIGGCPHAPGASGNVSTEDLVHMLLSMGISTDISFDKIIALRAQVATWLAGENLYGTLWRAGLPKTLQTLEAVV